MTSPIEPAPVPATPNSTAAASPPRLVARPYRQQWPRLGLAVVMIALALGFVTQHLGMPFANGRLQPGTDAIRSEGVVVTPLHAGPPGFQAGDVVTAVDGRSLDSWLRTPGSNWPPGDGDSVRISLIRDGQPLDVTVPLARYPLGAILRLEWGTVVYSLVGLLIATYVFLRRPQIPATGVLFLATAAQFSAVTWSFGLQLGDFVNGTTLWLYQLTTPGAYMLVWISYFHFAMLFPQPTWASRQRWFLPVVYGLPYLLLALYLLVTRLQADNLLGWVGRWNYFTGPQAAVFLSLAFAAMVWQYRRHRAGPMRQQLRWLVFAAATVAAAAVIFYFVPPLIGSRPWDSNLVAMIGVLFPLAIAISILRHNLFDIDTLLNRALVYGALTAVTISLYVIVVSILGTVLQTQLNLFVALVATGFVAVVFHPLRDRLQRAVNRFVYGERDEPFEVLSRLGQRLESSLSPEMVYPTIVETVSQALKIPYAAIALWQNGRLEIVESFGRLAADPVTYPLTYQGELVGELQVGRRAADEPFSTADERILDSVARQAGAAVHAVQLMADRQQSRQQLVAAREEERRRLRRDLHDGLGPQLASQALTIDAIDRLLVSDPERARALLQELKAQSQTAVQDIRRLVYELRPPTLDEYGLVGALREGAAATSQNGLRFAVQAPDPFPPLPAAVEVAAYRVAQEAMTNVIRHAAATTCTVRLSLLAGRQPPVLRLEVIDDGRGLPADLRPGVGLQSMRERAAELGGSCQIRANPSGGVTLIAEFPLPEDSKRDE
ncbi:MAG: histidine kinase [Anaerolineae bacterium]|nr:histidine kinase [Anaerolineae bacterium]